MLCLPSFESAVDWPRFEHFIYNHSSSQKQLNKNQCSFCSETYLFYFIETPITYDPGPNPKGYAKNGILFFKIN